MKYAMLAWAGLALAVAPTIARGQAPATKAEPSAELKTQDQKVAYAIGLNIGKNMKAQGVEVDPDFIAKGIKDGLADKAALTDAQIEDVMAAFRQQMTAKQAGMAAAESAKNLKAGQAFLAENKAKPGVTTLPSGLQFKILKAGTGKTPKLTDTVVANYKGTLIDGTPFDGSDGAEFPVNGVIPGWTEILQKMKVGDKYQVFIPADLAYGPQAQGKVIKANSALIFDIELVEVK